MTTMTTQALRTLELQRRAGALPAEISRWMSRARTEHDLNAHSSQLSAIEVLMGAILEPLQKSAHTLTPGAPDFAAASFDVVRGIIRAERIWGFFRDKLALRDAPDFKEPLWVADSIAWSCHRPVLEAAAANGILDPDKLREPPLTYLTAEFSPATWVRGSRPNDGRDYALGVATLPIPVIELPWDHVVNVWELLSLHHEVGHDIEADLGLRAPLAASVKQALEAAGAPPARVAVWGAWLGELFADLVGLQLGGPAFAEALMRLLMLPATEVLQYSKDDPHPTHHIRILMNAAYIPTLVQAPPGSVPAIVAARDRLQKAGDSLAARWIDMYGQPTAQLAPYQGDFATVFKAVMDTPFPVLQGRTVRDLMPFSAADDVRIRAAAGYLLTGQNAPAPLWISPRHCASAAQLAVMAANDAGGDVGAALSGIQARTMKLVRDSTPGGLRGSDSAPHRAFVAGFSDRISVRVEG